MCYSADARVEGPIDWGAPKLELAEERAGISSERNQTAGPLFGNDCPESELGQADVDPTSDAKRTSEAPEPGQSAPESTLGAIVGG